ncbi:MAG: hypothetical protein RR061_04105 [Muribaculaceae bacterium]
MKLRWVLAHNNNIARYWDAENAIERKLKGESIIEIISPKKTIEIKGDTGANNLKWIYLSFIDKCVFEYQRHRHDKAVIDFVLSDTFQIWFDLLDGFKGSYEKGYFFGCDTLFFHSLPSKPMSKIPTYFHPYIKGGDLSHLAFADNDCIFNNYSVDGEISRDTKLLTVPQMPVNLSLMKLIAIRIGKYYDKRGDTSFTCDTIIDVDAGKEFC